MLISGQFLSKAFLVGNGRYWSQVSPKKSPKTKSRACGSSDHAHFHIWAIKVKILKIPLSYHIVGVAKYNISTLSPVIIIFSHILKDIKFSFWFLQEPYKCDHIQQPLTLINYETIKDLMFPIMLDSYPILLVKQHN